MAPDKIFVHRTIHLGFLSASEIDITGQDEQFIRKDALLEWLEKRLQEVGLAGTIHIIDVIDKLNSM